MTNYLREYVSFCYGIKDKINTGIVDLKNDDIIPIPEAKPEVEDSSTDTKRVLTPDEDKHPLTTDVELMKHEVFEPYKIHDSSSSYL